MAVLNESHSEALSLRRGTAVVCVLLVGLVFAAEAMHSHPLVAAGKVGSPASHCSLCVVAHGTAPAAAMALLHLSSSTHYLVAAATALCVSRTEIIQLFVRPPPTLR